MTQSSPTIFIVDDEHLVADMLKDYLQERHPEFVIKTFSTGEACLHCLDDNPSVVILDYYLNSRESGAANGLDILREIKERNKLLPVIMLSGQERYSTAAQSIRFGAVHYVIKGREAFYEINELVKSNI